MSEEHKKEAPKIVNCKIITVSDTRTKETDKSGQLMKRYLAENHHHVNAYDIVKDERTEIKQAIDEALKQKDVEVILINGGTGIAKRDVTIEVVESLLDKVMPGFGEIFRVLSFQEDIGSAAILSRATAGVVQNKVVFATPGSSGAVKLAMERLIIPELGHVMREIKKDLSRR
ncbi:molybdenum cofactor biosynthesis protein MoaB [Gracilibacillus boraciitolerans JCM 21714]|uniref:Molybdenum cofactor biosynthesis protein B n=1 Tax=Gracilibacillus boraciitolerans JCM 21714 TaxID=1298598 RepID=W4VGM5_9BACI|nr:MogA/MoaB family molybdenum cofactor biosynthesis protein [Gracilibacillus boraciitolerans]GAE92321.1 molybdenum cofactor biosynthesis protein MoaB [Gracilibacillus boraciitolerans JCM 21714]